MSDFDDLRRRLTGLDAEAAGLRSAARAAQLSAAAAPADRERAAKAAAARERAAGAHREWAAGLREFERFSDPRRNAERLPDSSPVLLLPLRLETRFMGDELWVRIYPDECSVDAFDAELSTAEVAAGGEFWRAYWRAGGVDAESRAAWRALAGTYGAGRAGWIVRAFAPLNPGDRPAKDPATDVVLVIAGADLPIQRSALGEYWRAVWRDPSAKATARAALEAVVGPSADDLIAATVPANLTDPPPPGKTPAETTVLIAWLDLPDVAGEDRPGWRRAPMAAALPERFVVTGYVGTSPAAEAVGGPVTEPLYVGPDPAAPPDEQIAPEDGKLTIPEPLRWLVDFPAAEAAGMAVRLPLTADLTERGFDKLVVVGLRLRDTAEAGSTTLAGLLAGHRFSRSGFELLAQGSPTNNTDDAPSAWSRRADADLAFDDLFGPEKFTVAADPLERRDGQVFADAVGLDPTELQRVRGADGRDALEARAMNAALAPGTVGYLAGTLMNPVFEDVVDDIAGFFTRYVTGRGPIPAVRIGGQPYGVIASTAFSRISWLTERSGFLRRLHDILSALDAYWRAQPVAHVGDGQDPHRTLLDILGLHPNSAEFHIRRGKTLDELVSRGRFLRLGGKVSARARAAQQRQQALNLLRTLGYTGPEPDLLDVFFRTGQDLLKGPLVETPLSESESLADATTDGRNYLEWLADAAGTSLDALRRQEGFTDDAPPKALLYLMLHFALTRGYQDAGDRLRIETGVWARDDVRALRREPTSVHLRPDLTTSDSPWTRLYDPDERLTGHPTRSVADHLTGVLPTRPAYAADLAEAIRAVKLLTQTPTARLERALVEHVDTLSYRIDAWWLGLVTWQLERMRSRDQQGGGVYLGAYGWLTEVRPKARSFPAPELPPELAETFADGPPLRVDPTNGGHLHAPSLNQAVTAAVLRAGELAGRPSEFSVNLASERVRKAVALLDGIRSGQNLGALLGYRFERALHDAGGFVELDALVFAFRRAFPLTAQRLTPTQTPPPPGDEAIEARNVVDGLALAQRAAESYPYGKPLPVLTSTQRAVVEQAVRDVHNQFDALADLVLAEGVHQAAQGGHDRAAAQLDVAADFLAPPDPSVVRTPDRGVALTCRVGLELDPSATATAGAPPRAKANPQLNAWLASALPPLNTIACRVTWPGGHQAVTLAQLGLAPIDVINLVADSGGAGLAELDDRIRRRIVLTRNPRADAPLTIGYADAGPGQLSVFAASALVARLRGIALRSRPLRSTDVALPGSAKKAATAHVVDRARLADVVNDLTAVRDDLDAAIAAPTPSRPTVLAQIDTRIATVVDRLAETAEFGGARIGWGGLYDWRAERFTALLERVSGLLDRWSDRLDAAQQALDDEAALPGTATPEERVRLLRAAEGQVSTTLDPAVDPVPLRTAVEAKLTAFTTKADAIRTNALDAPSPSLADRLARCAAILPLDAFDPEPVTFTDIEDSVVSYWTDLQAQLTTARADVHESITAAAKALTAHDAATDAEARLKALQQGAVAVFGEGFQLVPTFTLPAAAGAEQTQAHAHFTSGGLLAHAKTALDDDDPLDTWFAGAARVRPKLRLLEDATALWEAQHLAIGSPAAMQLPHRAGAPWLALDFPKEHSPTGESLVYVGLVRTGFDPAATRCGLLLDDWSETIPALEPDEPGPQHTTGVAFHYDRPSQEPPQAMLLLTPAQWDGRWHWADIVQGVVDTFELAELRAVEPDRLAETELAQFLPATVASVTTSGLLLAANYALANTDVHIVRSADG